MSEQDATQRDETERDDLAAYEDIEAAFRALPPEHRYSNYTVINASRTLTRLEVASEAALVKEFAEARGVLATVLMDHEYVAFVSLSGPAGAIADVAADMIAVGYACAG